MTAPSSPARPAPVASPPPAPPPLAMREPRLPERPARRPLGPALRARAVELWHGRGLLYELTRRDVRVRYAEAVLGVVWALLTPALVVLSGVLVRVALAHAAAEPGRRTLLAAGIAVKAVPWAFFTGAVVSGTVSLTAHAGLLTKVYFPRMVLPLSAVLVHAVDLGAGALAVVVLLAVAGVGATTALLWVPVLLALLLLLAAAAALALSCANLFWRDVRHLVQLVVTFGLFVTPVFVEPAMLGARGARLMMRNPLAPLLEGLRLAVMDGHDLLRPLVGAGGVVAWRPGDLAYAAAWCVGGFAAAAVLFVRLERRFADHA